MSEVTPSLILLLYAYRYYLSGPLLETKVFLRLSRFCLFIEVTEVLTFHDIFIVCTRQRYPSFSQSPSISMSKHNRSGGLLSEKGCNSQNHVRSRNLFTVDTHCIKLHTWIRVTIIFSGPHVRVVPICSITPDNATTPC